MLTDPNLFVATLSLLAVSNPTTPNVLLAFFAPLIPAVADMSCKYVFCGSEFVDIGSILATVSSNMMKNMQSFSSILSIVEKLPVAAEYVQYIKITKIALAVHHLLQNGYDLATKDIPELVTKYTHDSYKDVFINAEANECENLEQNFVCTTQGVCIECMDDFYNI